MNNNEFCHLHVHNEYSLLDGYGTAEAYVKRAKNLGFDYLALTNHANIDGLIQFQKACNKFQLHPVIDFLHHFKATTYFGLVDNILF